MAIENFKIYTDPLLTQPLTTDLIYIHNSNGSTGNVDKVLYLGSTNPAMSLRATANPDVDQISLSITDSDANAGTPKPLDIKLALNQPALDSAVEGASLDLGTIISGGVANAIAIYIRSSQPDGVGNDLSISTNDVTES